MKHPGGRWQWHEREGCVTCRPAHGHNPKPRANHWRTSVPFVSIFLQCIGVKDSGKQRPIRLVSTSSCQSKKGSKRNHNILHFPGVQFRRFPLGHLRNDHLSSDTSPTVAQPRPDIQSIVPLLRHASFPTYILCFCGARVTKETRWS